MTKSFEFSIVEGLDIEAMLERARIEAKGAGIVLQGDSYSGRFQGTAGGTYSVDGAKIKVDVTEKPSFVPWGMIERALQKVFG